MGKCVHNLFNLRPTIGLLCCRSWDLEPFITSTCLELCFKHLIQLEQLVRTTKVERTDQIEFMRPRVVEPGGFAHPT